MMESSLYKFFTGAQRAQDVCSSENMAKKPRLLIVEDENSILQGLVDVFVFHGYDVEFATDGQVGLEKALSSCFDLVVLDVMLPGLDGFTICHELKKQKPEQPVILLTAKTSEDDVVTGLSLGADDYVGKPFSVRELTLRAQAVLRRAGRTNDNILELLIGDYIRIDTRNLVGTIGVELEPLPFTRKEIEILVYLHRHPGRPVSREELLSEVWGYARTENIETRTVDIHIAKLRRKIERDPKAPLHLVTVRGGGYRLDGSRG